MSVDTVGYAAAFGGGVISFLSPCVLPLVPAYLTIVTGLEIGEIEEPTRRHLGRIARACASRPATSSPPTRTSVTPPSSTPWSK